MAGMNSTISIELDSYNAEEVEKLHRLMNARALRKKRIRAGCCKYHFCPVYAVPAFILCQRIYYAGR